MYKSIVNPITGKNISIKTKKGKSIIKNYINILKGGSFKVNNNLESLIKNAYTKFYENCNTNSEHLKIKINPNTLNFENSEQLTNYYENRSCQIGTNLNLLYSECENDNNEACKKLIIPKWTKNSPYWHEINITGDGDCFYHAVITYLKAFNLLPKFRRPYQLREALKNYFMNDKHWSEFQNKFIPGLTRDEIIQRVNNYCKKFLQDNEDEVQKLLIEKVKLHVLLKL